MHDIYPDLIGLLLRFDTQEDLRKYEEIANEWGWTTQLYAPLTLLVRCDSTKELALEAYELR